MSTVSVPIPVPSPSDDAETIRKALQGWRADKEALVNVLSRRTAAQRSAIRRAYAFLYREPLLNCFRHRLSRRHCLLSLDFWKAMILWTMDPAERDANLVHGAIRRRGDDDVAVLVEVACASEPDHLMAVRRAYRSLFGSSVEEDLAASSAFTQPLNKMLVRLLSSYRYAGDRVDTADVDLDAAQLSNAIRTTTNHPPHAEVIIRILAARSKPHLRATFLKYRQEATNGAGADIADDIGTRYSNTTTGTERQFGRALKSAVWCLASPEKHFAEVIRRSVLGVGTYEDMLTRAVVSRAEVDMDGVKREYRGRFRTTVASDVRGDTSLAYRDMLLALVGADDDDDELRK